uniref:XK-related protein n=2 Tax=Denticeps clupeoides TaxID=299321 RepID=A0AAY4D183_9TELE
MHYFPRPLFLPTVILCSARYLWAGRIVWAWLTLVLMLPGSAAQVLSLRWYLSDDEQGTSSLLVLIHVLHLGILKRLWGCMRSLWLQQKGGARLGELVMQQADVSALCLLEALTLSLPETLLQSYILFSADMGLLSPACLCCGLGLLSLSWALVLFSRGCSLIRPGHLPMPPAAIMCQLLWRLGMLAARIASLIFFTKVFTWWVCGIVAFHWLIATFWMVSQQTDVCRENSHCRLFNCIMGVVHVFFFLNVKDGPSRFRMVTFYLVMLLENFALLLSASDIFSEASWDTLSIPTAVFCCFLMSIISMTIYYRFLHPKSTEILQSLHQHPRHGCLEQGSSLDAKDTSDPSVRRHGTFSITGVAQTLPKQSEASNVEKPDVPLNHHHWLLVRLALKTSDWSKINLAYDAGALAALLHLEEIPGGCGSASTPASVPKLSQPDAEGASDPPEKEPDSSGFGVRRGSLEFKSVLTDNLEPNQVPAESGTTIYFSADPNTPSCTSVLPADQDRNLHDAEKLSSIFSPGAQIWGAKVFLHKKPQYTSTPKQEFNKAQITGGSRRQVQFK